MRALMSILLVALLVTGCRGSHAVTGPGVAIISVALDRSSCSRTIPVRTYIDGNHTGLHDLAPGGSADFASGEGYHTLEAREEGGLNYRWKTGQIYVSAAGYNLILRCP